MSIIFIEVLVYARTETLIYASGLIVVYASTVYSVPLKAKYSCWVYRNKIVQLLYVRKTELQIILFFIYGCKPLYQYLSFQLSHLYVGRNASVGNILLVVITNYVLGIPCMKHVAPYSYRNLRYRIWMQNMLYTYMR